MNIRRKTRSASMRGFTLIEVLVYMCIFVVVVGCAVKALFECWDNTKALRRNADDVARAVEIGERWRADIRGARGAVQLTEENGSEQLRIPCLAGDVTYTSVGGEIRRHEAANAPDAIWLGNVKSSRMQSEMRGRVAAWRWELELKSERRDARLRPLFTFESATGTAANP